MTIILLVGAALGVLGERLLRPKPAVVDEMPAYGVRVKPGPWGDLYYVPFSIAAPDEILPVRSAEENPTHWFFPNCSKERLALDLKHAETPEAVRDALLADAVEQDQPPGVLVTPTAEALLALPVDARNEIYLQLAQSPENRSQLFFIHKDSFKDRFADSGLASETIALFKKLCAEQGDYFIFSGMSVLLSQLPTYEEKQRFMKAITRQRTMLLRLRVTPETDFAALEQYWGKGAWGTDIRTILGSMAKATGGTWINVLMVLPPVPASELYFYPVVQDNPLNGPTINRDCHWTSLNFFRDTPDASFAKPEVVRERLKTDYYPVPADPRYGDILLLTKPDGTVIHSAVYIADDIVFTKNGATLLYPWMLSRVPDLLKQYSFEVAPNERLTITYYRNKTL